MLTDKQIEDTRYLSFAISSGLTEPTAEEVRKLAAVFFQLSDEHHFLRNRVNVLESGSAMSVVRHPFLSKECK